MFVGGPAVDRFEREFAAFCSARLAVGVSSGTDALRFALMAAGVREGDTVLTVPNTFIATGEAISQVGATPEFVDIDEQTYNMSPACLREYLETPVRHGSSHRPADLTPDWEARDCGSAGASLRSNGRHGRDPGHCRRV